MGLRDMAMMLVGMGWRLALPIVVCTLAGAWLDKRLDSRPWFALVGLGLGTLVGYYSVYRLLQPYIREVTGKKGKGP